MLQESKTLQLILLLKDRDLDMRAAEAFLNCEEATIKSAIQNINKHFRATRVTIRKGKISLDNKGNIKVGVGSHAGSLCLVSPFNNKTDNKKTLWDLEEYIELKHMNTFRNKINVTLAAIIATGMLAGIGYIIFK